MSSAVLTEQKPNTPVKQFFKFISFFTNDELEFL